LDKTNGEGWLFSNLSFEIKRASRRVKKAEEEKQKIREQVLSARIKRLKQTPDQEYGDLFNRIVCQKLDQLQEQATPLPQPGLAYAQTVVEKEIEQEIEDGDLVLFLAQKEEERKQKRFERNKEEGSRLFGDSESVFKYASILFEIEQRQVETIWNPKVLREIIARGLRGSAVKLISVICCLNQYNGQGGCSINPDVYTYQKDRSAYPIPLIVDELIAVRRFFEFYGISTSLSIYVPDTEYTEVEKFGPINSEISQQVSCYTKNLQEFVSQKDGSGKTIVEPISTLMVNNPNYQKTKSKVLDKVSKWKDPDFTRRWYQRFEQYNEGMCQRIGKRKIYPPQETRTKALEITRRRWAVNAAEGAVFSTLGPNTIIISSETRERDTIYAVDETTNGNFPPVLYILRASEIWNRKLLKDSRLEGEK